MGSWEWPELDLSDCCFFSFFGCCGVWGWGWGGEGRERRLGGEVVILPRFKCHH